MEITFSNIFKEKPKKTEMEVISLKWVRRPYIGDYNKRSKRTISLLHKFSIVYGRKSENPRNLFIRSDTTKRLKARRKKASSQRKV